MLIAKLGFIDKQIDSEKEETPSLSSFNSNVYQVTFLNNSYNRIYICSCVK